MALANSPSLVQHPDQPRCVPRAAYGLSPILRLRRRRVFDTVPVAGTPTHLKTRLAPMTAMACARQGNKSDI